MARTEITAQTVAIAGVEPTETVGQADGHFFANPASTARYGTRFARVRNSGASARDITFQTAAQVEGHEIAEMVVSIPAGESRVVGPFSIRVFNRAADEATNPNKVYVDYDAAAPTELHLELWEFPIT